MHRTPNITPPRLDRAAEQPRRRMPALALIALSALLAAALIVVTAVIVAKNVGAASADAGDAGASRAGCIDPDVRITADPAVAEALTAILEGIDGCEAPAVTAAASAVTAAAIAAGDAPGFDIWIPDSEMWTTAAAGEQAESPLVVGDLIASTPIVFAATDATAQALGPEPGFAGLAAATGLSAVYLPDPMTVASSSGALLAAQLALPGDPRLFTGLVLSLTKNVPTPAEALDAAAAAGSPALAVTTEQELRAYNAAHADAALTAIHPSDAQPSSGIPLVTTSDASDAVIAASDAIADAVASDAAQLAAHGLRDADGDLAGEDLATVAPGDSTNQFEVMKTWRVLTAPSRMLALNDVSGSMSQPASGDETRIGLFSQAAVRAIDSLSEDSSLAIWVFSSRRIGGQDWQEVVEFGSLGDPAHKQLALDTADDLHTYVGGGTGLYDSVLAAVTYMQDTYVDGQVNLVLLNTDGYNEDDDGLDLDGLLAELERIQDPAKPVPVIAIGYGPDTDQDALEQIAAATDGAAYQALEPTDISTVLVDAVTQRGCRPYCG